MPRLETPWTDLAVEQHEAARRQPGRLDGVVSEAEPFEGGQVTRVRVLDEAGAARLGRPPGIYTTIEAPRLRQREKTFAKELSRRVAAELARLVELGPQGEALVVGLGNWKATPDALGPRVVARLLVTRHLRGHLPAELTDKLRAVSAVAPGVLGITGIETGDMVKGIVEQIRPDLVIAIDALAARSVDRLATTIQLTDTGIAPGSGVGNERPSIQRASLGCPVIAVGVPTVVHALTIAAEPIERLLEQHAGNGVLGEVRSEGALAFVGRTASPVLSEMIVTPREVDTLIDDLAAIIANGLNAYLQPGIDEENMALYLD